MVPSRRVQRLVVLAGLVVVYFIAGKLGLRLAFVHASATAVWPPAGITLATFLILGPRVWPAILLGAFLVNLTTAGSIATSIGIGVGNTLEGLVGAYLVNRFARGSKAFEHPQDIFKFAALAAVASTTLSATFGVTILSLGGFARWADYGSIWLTWWLGDAAGDLIVAPVVLLWSTRPRIRWRPKKLFEAALLLVSLVLAGQVVFAGHFPSDVKNYPLEFLCIPFLLWAAFRFGQRGAATSVLLLSGIAIWGTLRGFGPFVRETQNESLLLLQAFLGVVSVTTLTLASVVSERKQVEKQLRHLAVSDPLTGIANYRHLIAVLQAEILRSDRTERPLTLLFLDMDGLKKVNDRHGHVVGNEALCRVARVLQLSSRAMDTPARFGGDEFALVLPEIDETAAWQAAHRISEQLARDGQTPPVSVSLGVAVYPRDGRTAEALLDAADRTLYEVKNRGKSE
jgi:diguanylate cyclase (GGDEF)-like protein